MTRPSQDVKREVRVNRPRTMQKNSSIMSPRNRVPALVFCPPRTCLPFSDLGALTFFGGGGSLPRREDGGRAAERATREGRVNTRGAEAARLAVSCVTPGANKVHAPTQQLPARPLTTTACGFFTSRRHCHCRYCCWCWLRPWPTHPKPLFMLIAWRSRRVCCLHDAIRSREEDSDAHGGEATKPLADANAAAAHTRDRNPCMVQS